MHCRSIFVDVDRIMIIMIMIKNSRNGRVSGERVNMGTLKMQEWKMQER